MFLRIFVPLDGSKFSEQALDMAALLARREGIREPNMKPLVTLFQVVDVSSWPFDGERTRAQAVNDAITYLEGQAERLRSQGITVETAVRLGNPAEEILEQTMGRQAEVIVMSTHGRSGLARWALGSVAERVARAASVPVLLVPGTPTSAPEAKELPTSQLTRILVPLDGSVAAEAAIQPAITLARLFKCEVRLLYVFIPRFEEQSVLEQHSSWDAGRRRVHQIERYLIRKADEMKHEGVHHVRWGLGYGMPAPQIIADAREHQVGLIVMTTQGRGGVARGRLGRVAEEVIHQGQISVLLASLEEKAEQITSQRENEITPLIT